MAASAEITNGDHAVELIVQDTSASAAPNGNDGCGRLEEITPLLKQPEKPKINIFSLSYSRTRPREQVIKLVETEISPVTQFVLWVWGGSRYSGLLCMVLSSIIYFIMGVLSDIFSAQPIPLFETAFARCTIVLVFSYLWLKRGGQPIFGPVHARKFHFSRALLGFLSLLSFIYCIKRLPLSQAIVLSLTTPIMAAILARFILHEKLKISDIGGLAFSFFGVLFIFRQILASQGRWARAGEANITAVDGKQHLYAVLVGLFSSVTGGISYCLIRAGAKASDQPVATVFAFGILASPATGIWAFAFEEFVLPDIYSFFLMLIVGVLAFFAEVFLARGLQLEKTSKAANIVYIEVALSQLWGIASTRIIPSFGGLVGCLLIIISVCCTIYIGPDKEIE